MIKFRLTRKKLAYVLLFSMSGVLCIVGVAASAHRHGNELRELELVRARLTACADALDEYADSSDGMRFVAALEFGRAAAGLEIDSASSRKLAELCERLRALDAPDDLESLASAFRDAASTPEELSELKHRLALATHREVEYVPSPFADKRCERYALESARRLALELLGNGSPELARVGSVFSGECANVAISIGCADGSLLELAHIRIDPSGLEASRTLGEDELYELASRTLGLLCNGKTDCERVSELGALRLFEGGGYRLVLDSLGRLWLAEKGE